MRLSTLWLPSGYAIRGPCLREMHIFAFSCQTRYRIASALYPCIALVGASIRHQVRGTTWLCLAFSSHRTSKLDLTCLAHDPTHTHLRVCSPARHLGWSSLAGLDPAIDHNIFILVSEKKEKGGRRKTTKTTTTTPSRHHQQTHRPIVYRLLLSRSLLSMNQPRR